ncbi:MAG: DNA/RNA nuclease SfsA [Eubacteriaceae bacterium]|nr:DNA/RNA nuclease SfsA [Eubacteriaceae bacterium]
MKYKNIVEGIFINRPNRFIANVEILGNIETVHVKNTGRCRELLQDGAKVYLEHCDHDHRKTKYDLITVEKHLADGRLKMINMDSQVPNKVVYDALMTRKIPELKGAFNIRKEVTYGHSRLDLYYETDDTKGFIEVKGVTLEENGVARFPDAPTLRGSKHIESLMEGQREGMQNYIFFVIQMKDILRFEPNIDMDMKFSRTLHAASEAGVKILCYDCLVTPGSIEISENIPHSFQTINW